MDTALIGGDFELCGRGMPYLLSGLAEIMQRIYICLKIKKGSFVYDRDLGSELNTVEEDPQLLASRAEMLLKEAVVKLPNVKLKNIKAQLKEERLTLSFDIYFQGEEQRMEVVV